MLTLSAFVTSGAACDPSRTPEAGARTAVALDAGPSEASTSPTRSARPTRPGPEPTWVDTDRCPEPCPASTDCVTETQADGAKRAACRARCTTTEDCPAPEVCGAPSVATGYCTNDRWREVLEVDCTHPATTDAHAHH
ncbi:hypothetical protein L6R52_17350 [Myxococcota bacterium]|nr:hypothetical protein [Myxococcota bacterium]